MGKKSRVYRLVFFLILFFSFSCKQQVNEEAIHLLKRKINQNEDINRTKLVHQWNKESNSETHKYFRTQEVTSIEQFKLKNDSMFYFDNYCKKEKSMTLSYGEEKITTSVFFYEDKIGIDGSFIIFWAENYGVLGIYYVSWASIYLYQNPKYPKLEELIYQTAIEIYKENT